MGQIQSVVSRHFHEHDSLASQLRSSHYQLVDNTWILTGIQGSGKTTIWRQIKYLFSPEIDDTEDEELLTDYKTSIITSLLTSTESIARTCRDKLESIDATEAATTIFEQDNQVENYNEDIAGAVSMLWQDPAFTKAYEDSNFVSYGVKVLAERCQRWTRSTWVPSKDEILRSHLMTTGMMEHTLNLGDTSIKVYDCGNNSGRSLRLLLEQIKFPFVVFVASLSSYNETTESGKNILMESLNYFSTSANHLKDMNAEGEVVLILNKSDVFREQLTRKKIPLNKSGSFPDAPRSFDYDEGVEWIKQEFEKRIEETMLLQVNVMDAFNEDDIADFVTTLFPAVKQE